VGEQNDRHESGGTGFVMGFFVGAAIGAALGVLLAPKPGSELRDELGERARKLGNLANEQYKRAGAAASGLAERGRDAATRAREAVAHGVDDARSFAGRVGLRAEGTDPESSGGGQG